jgi:hypothetical protein
MLAILKEAHLPAEIVAATISQGNMGVNQLSGGTLPRQSIANTS